MFPFGQVHPHPSNTPDLIAVSPQEAWTPAYDAYDKVRDGGWVAELTDPIDLSD